MTATYRLMAVVAAVLLSASAQAAPELTGFEGCDIAIASLSEEGFVGTCEYLYSKENRNWFYVYNLRQTPYEDGVLTFALVVLALMSADQYVAARTGGFIVRNNVTGGMAGINAEDARSCARSYLRKDEMFKNCLTLYAKFSNE